MNRKDLGKYLGNLFSFKRTKTLATKEEKKVTPQIKIKSFSYSSIPTVKAIRMAQNRKQLIKKEAKDDERKTNV